MAKKQQKFEFKSDEEKKVYLDQIIGYFETERDEEIGYIAAEDVLDFFLSTFGKEIYKKALEDTKQMLREKMTDLEIELDLLIDK